MPRAPRPSSGVYEKNPGSRIWYIRYRINGKLVRKKIGTRQQAIDQLDKVRFLRASGERHQWLQDCRADAAGPTG